MPSLVFGRIVSHCSSRLCRVWFKSCCVAPCPPPHPTPPSKNQSCLRKRPANASY